MIVRDLVFEIDNRDIEESNLVVWDENEEIVGKIKMRREEVVELLINFYENNVYNEDMMKKVEEDIKRVRDEVKKFDR